MKRLRLLFAAAAIALIGAVSVPSYACPNDKDCDCHKQGKKCKHGDKCKCAKHKHEAPPVKK